MSGAVHFTRIDVGRMPGFPRGGLAVEGLAAGINVVYGPNASGKTTLARAMQRLLRPHADGRHTDLLTAEVAVAGQFYEVEYHAGQFVCRRGGSETIFPVSAPSEVGGRYVLALHELIQQEDDHDIVQQILREAAGGYDVGAAAKELRFDRDRPSGRNIKALKDYDEAVRARKEAEERLLGIDRDSQQLTDLERQRTAAHEAQLRQSVLEKALEALAKRDELDRSHDAVAAFPEAMSQLVGDEWQRLTGFKAQLAELREQFAAATTKYDQANKELLATGLPEAGLPDGLIETLQRRCDSLRATAGEVTRLGNELAGLEAELDDALQHLGPETSPERAASLDASMLDKLFSFVRQVEDHRLDRVAADRLANWLNVVPPTKQDPEMLREGITLLQRWLAEQRIVPERANPRTEWLAAAGITAVASVALSFVHLSWLLLLVLAGGFAAWALLRAQALSASTELEKIVAEWSGLQLTPPTAWAADDVRVALRRLQQEWAAARLYQEKSERFAELGGRRSESAERDRRIEGVRRNWREQLGVDVDVDDCRLYLLAEAVARAQSAQARASAAEERLSAAQRQHDEILAAINTELGAFTDSSAVDVDAALGLVRNLDQRYQDRREASGHRDQAERDIREYRQQVNIVEADLCNLFAKLGLTTDDESTLYQWCEQFPDYTAAKESFRLAEHDARNASSALAGHEELLKQTDEQLEAELERCRHLAATLEGLDRQIGDIEGRVRAAKRETALEAALAAEEARLDELGAARESDYAQLVGNVLANYVMRQQRDVQQPGVLKRAGELFARITHGRYQLLVEPGDPPGFRALDTSLGREQNLDELSSGTRLQLLLSVRVAFIEQQEHGLQLPLIFDETLGNSDEQRAARIIEAAVEIAREGRQVFYLTAQYDELGKWRRALRDCTDVAHREFDLARLRGFSEVEHAPDAIDFEPPPRVPIPPPDGDGWEAYGRRLKVPSLDRRGHVGGVHLWYLMDDVHGLYRLLTHDINKWGQLQTLVEIGSANGITRDSLLFRRASAAASLLEHLLRYWRQGRGEPVDRTVLEASGAVSSAFIDEVSELAESLNGNARQLIESLRASQVKRFRNDRIEALETYLAERGYVDDQPILATGEVREIVTPLVFADCENGLLTRERVDRLIALVMS